MSLTTATANVAVNCVICDEKLNKSTRRPIQCNHCNLTACADCYKEFFKTCDEPTCMFPDCKKPWNRKFCTYAFTKSFMAKTYKNIKEDRLFNREQSLLPATQLTVEQYNRHHRLLENSVHMYQWYADILSEQHVQLLKQYNNKRFKRMMKFKQTINKDYQELHFDMQKNGANSVLGEGIVTRQDFVNRYEDRCKICYETQGSYLHRSDMCYSCRRDKNYLKLLELENLKSKRKRQVSILNNRKITLLNDIIAGYVHFIDPTRRIHTVDPNEAADADADANANGEGDGNGEEEHSKKKKRVFMRACPNNDCRGFLNTKWKCGLCGYFTCSKCHVLKDKGNPDDADEEDANTTHVCNEDDVASATLMKKDSKPCPSCASSIFKISGCDQMWCTMCNTAFSWNTGAILTRGIIHNPHYFEWMRRQNNDGEGVADRNPLEVRCGRELDNIFVREIRRKMLQHEVSETKVNNIYTIIRSVNHIQGVANGMQVNQEENNVHIRFRYLTHNITLDNFKKLVQMANKRTEHKRERRDILITFVQTMTDILYDYYDTLSDAKLDEINAFVAYINDECFAELQTVYNTSMKYHINVYGGWGDTYITINSKTKKTRNIHT